MREGAEKAKTQDREAVVLLGRARTLLAQDNAPCSLRERCHVRLVAAHDARDTGAHRLALNGYAQPARRAHRKIGKGG